MRGHGVDAKQLGRVDHVPALCPQRRCRALPAIAAVEQQGRGAARLQPLDQRRKVREASDLTVHFCRGNEIARRECMRVTRSRRNAEVTQERLAHQMRWASRGIANAEVDARLAKVRRQQLGVTIGEVQKMHVAEARHVVGAYGLLRRGAAAREGKARCGRRREDLKEFAAVQADLRRPPLKTPALGRCAVARPSLPSSPRRRESIGFLTVAKWIPASAGMTHPLPIAATLRVLLLDGCAMPLAPTSSFPRRRESIGFLTVAKWIPAFAGMTHPLPIAATLRVLLLDGCVTC